MPKRNSPLPLKSGTVYEKTRHSDFAAVRGIFEEDSFVSEIEHHIISKTALGDELISRVEKLRQQQPNQIRRNV
jgi:hypothetical protein